MATCHVRATLDASCTAGRGDEQRARW